MSSQPTRFAMAMAVAALLAAVFAATAAAATVKTEAATEIAIGKATLNGTIETGGKPAEYVFGYATAEYYAEHGGYEGGTKVVSIPKGETGAVHVSSRVKGLTNDQSYVFNLAARIEGSGFFKGSQLKFTTLTGHEPRFDASEFPAYVTGLQSTSDPLVLSVGGGEVVVQCESVELAGQATTATSELSLHRLYIGTSFEGCEDVVSASPVTVEMNSCSYVFGLANTGPPYAGAMGVDCAKEGDAIEVELPEWESTLTVGEQAPTGKVDYENQQEGSIQRVHADLAVKYFHYGCEGGLLCYVLNGEDGTMSGGIDASAVNQKAEPVDFQIDGEEILELSVIGEESTEEANQPRFDAPEYPGSIAADQSTSGEVTLVSVGGGEAQVRCQSAHWTGEATAAAPELSLAASFEGCEDTVSDSPATVKMNSCRYLFSLANVGPPYSGGLGVSCAKEGDAIEIVIPELELTLTIGGQAPVSKVTYENEEEGPVQLVHADLAVKKLHYGCEGAPLCYGLNGEDGTMSGGIDLR